MSPSDEQIRELRSKQVELERQNQILLSQNQQLGLLFDAIPDPVFYADLASMQFIHVNAAACAMLGYGESDLLGLQLPQITAPYLHAKLHEAILQLHDVGRCVVESEFVKRNRVRVAVEIHAKKIDINSLPVLVASVRDITARKQLEVSLFETGNRFRFVLDSLPQLIWLKDRHGKYIFGNTAYIRRLGITVADIIGKSDTDFYAPDQARKYQDDDTLVCLTKTMRVFDERIFFQGIERFVRTTKVPLLNAHRLVYSTLGIAEDITDLKSAQLQIRKLVQAVEQSPECIVITNLDAEIEFVNESFLHTTGYRREELIGKNSRMLQSGKTPRKSYQQLWDALTNGRQWQGELYNRRKDGKEYIEFARIAPIRQEDGRISHYLAIKEDITEKKRNNTLILESKILLQRVVDSIPDWVFVFDKLNRYMLVNESYATFFDLRTDLMVGLTDEEIHQVAPTEESPFRFGLNRVDNIMAVFNGQSIHHRSETVTMSGNRLHVFETYWIPLLDAAQTVYGALCYRREITERIHSEQQQRQLVEQLHQAQKMEMVGQFTGGIAHDFNNILASIFGYAELLKEAPAVIAQPRLEKYVDQILLVGQRARDLIRNLMVLSQKDEAQQQPINVASSVAEVMESLRPTFPAGIDIILSLDQSLSNVLISPVQLHQVIMNLAVNARDAMAGSGVLDISLASAEIDSPGLCDSCHGTFTGRFVKLSVRDSGSGIEADVLKRIFDPFFSTKKLAGGSGLGLSVIHGIIHSAGGHICVASTPGQGTQFTVFFPATALTPMQLPMRPLATALRRKARIMLVDDEPAIVSYLNEFLQSNGYQVSAHTEARLALHQFQAAPNEIDLLITDQEMPDLNGVEMVKAMHLLRADLPVVMCTGYSREIDEKQAAELGILQFLIKPIPGNVLLQAIDACTDLKQ